MNKKLTIRSALSALFVAALASACLFGCSGQATTSTSASAASGSSPDTAVLVEIDPSAAVGKVDIPSEDLAAFNEIVALPGEANVYDALVATGATLEGTESYVTSVNGLAEKAAGPTYGWMYEVNGEQPTVAANEYVVVQDDVVRWYYGSWEE